MKNKKRIIIISSIVILILISIIVILSKYEYEGRNVKRVEKGCTYIIAATGEELKEGAKIPTPANGDIYNTEDYKYKYVSDFLKDEDGSSGIYYFTYSLEACYWHDVEDKLEMKCPLEGLSGWEHSTINKDKEKEYIYLYIDEFDSVCHEFGPDSKEAKDLLAKIDEFVEKFARIYGNRVNTVITADHGQVRIKAENFFTIDSKDEMMDLLVAPPSGDSRCVSFHVKSGKFEDFKKIFTERYGEYLVMSWIRHIC